MQASVWLLFACKLHQNARCSRSDFSEGYWFGAFVPQSWGVCSPVVIKSSVIKVPQFLRSFDFFGEELSHQTSLLCPLSLPKRDAVVRGWNEMWTQHWILWLMGQMDALMWLCSSARGSGASYVEMERSDLLLFSFHVSCHTLCKPFMAYGCAKWSFGLGVKWWCLRLQWDL